MTSRATIICCATKYTFDDEESIAYLIRLAEQNNLAWWRSGRVLLIGEQILRVDAGRPPVEFDMHQVQRAIARVSERLRLAHLGKKAELFLHEL